MTHAIPAREGRRTHDDDNGGERDPVRELFIYPDGAIATQDGGLIEREVASSRAFLRSIEADLPPAGPRPTPRSMAGPALAKPPSRAPPS